MEIQNHCFLQLHTDQIDADQFKADVENDTLTSTETNYGYPCPSQNKAYIHYTTCTLVQ